MALPDQPEFRIRQQERHFTQDGTKIVYKIYDVDTSPSAILGDIGDVAENVDTVWYRNRDGWVVASKEVDNLGRPRQDHPIFKSKRRLEGLEWKAQTSWSNLKKRRVHEFSDIAVSSRHTRELSIPHSVTSHPEIPFNPENMWLMDLHRLWTSFPIARITPVQPIGSKILRELASHSHFLSRTPPDDANLFFPDTQAIFRRPPNLALVIHDLISSSYRHIFDFVNQYGDPDVQYPEFISSMIHATEDNSWDDTRRLYGALDIGSESPHGISSCHLEAHPFGSQKHSLVGNEWFSTWTPPGAISNTHMDFYGSMLYVIHFHGKKLWLLWPPTARNLDWFSFHHKQRATGDRILDSIRNLEGLQLHYLDGERKVFVLKPNTLHACLSLSSSGHAAVQVWSYDFFDSAHRMMEWGVEWLRGARHEHQPTVVQQQEIEILRQEIDRWSDLVKRNTRHTLSSRINRQLKALKDRLDEIDVEPPIPCIS